MTGEGIYIFDAKCVFVSHTGILGFKCVSVIYIPTLYISFVLKHDNASFLNTKKV